MASHRVALVTGAGSGIGRAVALSLNKAGFQVVLAGRTEKTLAETAGLGGAQMTAVVADVAQPSAVGNLFKTIGAQFGRLDVLFNNAGTGAPALEFDELTFQQWQAVVDVNLTGAFLCAQAAFRMMKSQDP